MSNFASTAILTIESRLDNNPSQHQLEKIIKMESGMQTVDALQKCELCDHKMNPTVKIYNNDTRLCKTCFDRMENMPEVVAKCVERFLIGNVV